MIPLILSESVDAGGQSDFEAMYLRWRDAMYRAALRIVRDPLLRSRILFGTDYPAFVHVFRPNRGNTFAAWMELFRSYGLGDDFFARGAKLIGLEDRK